MTHTPHPKTKVVWASLKFTKVPAPHPPTPSTFHSLPNPGSLRAGHDPCLEEEPKRTLSSPYPPLLQDQRIGPRSCQRPIVTHSHPRAAGPTVTAPQTPIGPTPSCHTHTRPRRPACVPSPACRLPAAPQGAGDDRGHLAPRVLPPAGPRRVGPPSARAGAEAAHPFIPGGREQGGHSQSRRRGGPARAILGVVVQAWETAGPRG